MPVGILGLDEGLLARTQRLAAGKVTPGVFADLAGGLHRVHLRKAVLDAGRCLGRGIRQGWNGKKGGQQQGAEKSKQVLVHGGKVRVEVRRLESARRPW